MIRFLSNKGISGGIAGVLCLGALCLTGCDRGKVTAYDIPKETPSTPSAQPATDQQTGNPHAGVPMSRPSVEWGELPSGWTQSPQSSGLRLATFTITGADGQSAEMAIIPMGGFAGTEEQLVNMWRMQLGLPELASAETEGQGKPVGIGGLEGRIYEMAGKAQDVDTRMIVASADKDGVHYFFKLIGHDALVSAQKPAFLEFLKGVTFSEAAPGASMPVPTLASSPSSERRWQVPSDWEELPATQFLLAKYRVAGEGDTSAEVTVSMLGGAAGGMLPNVNRWRGQLNLAPVDEAGLEPLMSDIKAGAVDAHLVTLEGTDLKTGAAGKMLAVIVPLPNETWFFKMTGPTAAVDAKTEDFRSFVNAARF